MDGVINYNLYKHKSNSFYCKGNQILEQVAWTGFGFSMHGVIQVLIGHSSVQPAVVGPALSKEVGLDLHRFLPTSSVVLYLQHTYCSFNRLRLSMLTFILKHIFMTKLQVLVRGL